MGLELFSHIQMPGSLASDSGRCCSMRLNCQSSGKLRWEHCPDARSRRSRWLLFAVSQPDLVAIIFG